MESIRRRNKICLEVNSELSPFYDFKITNNCSSESEVYTETGCEIQGWENFGGVELLDPELDSVTYESVFKDFLLRNHPCVFTERLTKDWESRKNWTRVVNGELEIDFEYLSLKYGNESVNVTNCDELMSEYGDSTNCQQMTIDAFLTYWKGYRDDGYPSSTPCLYLKDWHIMKNLSSIECPPYITPMYFASDWLNESCENKDDDFKFTYMGPKGTWTPFHCDVYGSFSWSANVIGTKKWRLYPPGKEIMFNNSKTKRLEYNFENPGVPNSDYYEIIQETGQVIFVPSGWHHIVWNLTDTISINHNWMNGTNVKFIWRNLRIALDEVEKELEDLRDAEDFSEICQGLLKANHGMNYSCYRDILRKIHENRLNSDYVVNNTYYFGPNHVHFDIETAKSAVQLLEQDKRYCTQQCSNMCNLVTDPCYQKLCCTTRKPISFKPFVPSYERCEEETKMGKLLGMDYQRRWFCERNVWMCEVYGQCGGGRCC